MGISEAFYIPAALALITDFHCGPTRSRAVGIHQMGIYAGIILGGFSGYVADSSGSWLALGVQRLRDHRDRLCRAAVRPAAESAASRRCAPEPSPGLAASRELFSNREFILLVLYFTLPALAGWVVKDWMPDILQGKIRSRPGKGRGVGRAVCADRVARRRRSRRLAGGSLDA